MKKLSYFLIAVIGIVAFSILFYQSLAPSVVYAAETEGEVTGWGWIGADCAEAGARYESPDNTICEKTTSPLGWISFNSSNTSGGTAYEVYADYEATAANTLQGEAWISTGPSSEKSIGWLLFNHNGVPSWETDNSNFARINPDTKVIKGWAPIKSKDENGNYTTISWVKFGGTNYSTKIVAGGEVGEGSTDHYAWAGGAESNEGTVFGWIDLNPALNNATLSTSTPEFPDPNQEPEIDFSSSGFDTVDKNSCAKTLTLNWLYEDPDGDEQSKYKWRIYDKGSGNLVLEDTVETSWDSPHKNSTSPLWMGTDLSYGRDYRWEVNVYDSKGEDSGWEDPGYGFSTPDHALPQPSFDVEPKSPEIDTIVTFEDNSTCYGGEDCADIADEKVVSYNWNFDYKINGTINNYETDSTYIGSATTTYPTDDDYTVRLGITDNLGETCYATKPVDPTIPLPEWEEVSSQ